MTGSPERKEVGKAICLEVRRIADSISVDLPTELLSKLKLKQGDKLYLVEMPDGNFQLSPHSVHHADAMAIARETMSEYRDTFSALAKS
jgi:antitoxin component of MazEF toxin-antitoxin module